MLDLKTNNQLQDNISGTEEKEVFSLSVTGRQWKLANVDENMAISIAREHEIPDLVARILVSRGIAVDDVADFLNPTLRNMLPDPSHLLDMDRAVKRICDAIIAKEKIAVFGDYDVDGATSSALLNRYFRAVGIPAIIYIPDRMKEGYGPNTEALLKLRGQGVSLVITVDCGTMSFEPLKAAKDAGLDVIVVDHHMGEARKPEAVAVVNPNRLDETSPHGQLAAVGVTFLLLVAMNRELRNRNFFANNNIQQPDIKQWLDIVALGTICDVVPLTRVNRALVAQGLKVMAIRRNIGISTLLDMAGCEEKPNSYSCGFIIGPRINAGGRVGRSDLGVRIVSTEDSVEAAKIAVELEQYNSERKAIEEMVLEQAMLQAEKIDDNTPSLMVYGKDWHIGVIGIVAGRLKERFNKPVAVISITDGVGKASARSVSGVDFGATVIAALEAGLLVAGGGHAMAAGFTVVENKIQDLSTFFNERIGRQLKNSPLVRSLTLDGIVDISGVTVDLLENLEHLAPFGQANPQVRIGIRQVTNFKSDIVGEKHVKTMFLDKISNKRLSAIAFRCVGSDLGDALLSSQGKIVDVAGQLRLNSWNGRQTPNMTIDDIVIY
ncbi:MAG: single-stranded-DNA-specific exonuclease RecJ [Rickettsiales bacterium]